MIKIITVSLLITHCIANPVPVLSPSAGNVQQVLLLGNRADVQSINGLFGASGLSGLSNNLRFSAQPIGQSINGLFGASGLSNLRFGAQPIGAIAVPVGLSSLAQTNAANFGSIQAIPISANRVVELAPTIQQPVEPQIVRVAADDVPIVVQFQTSSGPITVEQSHIPQAAGQVQVTRSEDEPQTVVHEVVRPVIQEVREIIQPYRRVTQQILPVEEQVNSLVATGGASAPSVAPVLTQVNAPQVVSQPIVSQVSQPQPQLLQTPVRTPPLNLQLQPIALSAVSSLPPLDLSSFRQLNLRLLPPLVAPELFSGSQSQENQIVVQQPNVVAQPINVDNAASVGNVVSGVSGVSANSQLSQAVADLSRRRLSRKYHEYPN